MMEVSVFGSGAFMELIMDLTCVVYEKIIGSCWWETSKDYSGFVLWVAFEFGYKKSRTQFSAINVPI